MEKGKLVNRTKIGSPIDKELYEWLKSYSAKTDIPISKLLDKAIREYKEKLEN